MKIFEKEDRVNFIDENNVLVGFDIYQCCCEDFGWFIDQEKSKTIKEHTNIDVSNYVFDTNFFEKIENCDEYEGGGIVIFKLVNGDK